MLSMESVVKASPDVIFSKVGEEVVLLNSTSGDYFGLNETGIRIWELVGNRITIGLVFQQLLKEYDVEQSRCEADLMNILQEMSNARLIHIA